MHHKTIAERLIALRAGANQAETAQRIGVPPATLSNWENGTIPPADAVKKLADHYGVSADYIVLRTDFPSGLAPDSFLVDLDAFERRKPGEAWAVKVPRRHKIVGYEEHEQMRKENARAVKRGGRAGRGGDENT